MKIRSYYVHDLTSDMNNEIGLMKNNLTDERAKLENPLSRLAKRTELTKEYNTLSGDETKARRQAIMNEIRELSNNKMHY